MTKLQVLIVLTHIDFVYKTVDDSDISNKLTISRVKYILRHKNVIFVSIKYIIITNLIN